MALGGARTGAGRPKGRETLDKLEMRSYIRKKLVEEHGPLIESQLEKAKGVLAVEWTEKLGENVYKTLPDPGAFKILMDHGFGKPLAAVEITGKDGSPLIPLDELLIRVTNAKNRYDQEAGQED